MCVPVPRHLWQTVEDVARGLFAERRCGANLDMLERTFYMQTGAQVSAVRARVECIMQTEAQEVGGLQREVVAVLRRRYASARVRSVSRSARPWS